MDEKQALNALQSRTSFGWSYVEIGLAAGFVMMAGWLLWRAK